MYEFKLQDAYDFARMKGKYREKGNEIELYQCPYCGGGRSDKWTFAINKDSGMFKCLRASCGATGNMITLAKDFDFSLGRDFDEYYTHKTMYKKLKQPEKIIPKENAITFLESRGISKETAEKYAITCQTNNEHILVFPFFDENNIMQFVKYRNTKYDGTGNKEWCEKDCKPILFGMNQCKGFDRIIITEGQMDSLSVSECGIDNAVSVPTGANGFTWIPHVWDWFVKFEEIIVFGDYEKGIITLLEELSKRFKTKIKHVREEDYKNCKDANELLQKHGKQAVIDAVNNAVKIPVSNVKKLSEVKSVDIYKLPKVATGINELDRLLKGGLLFGQCDIITGKRGEGKSTLTSQIVANAIDQGYRTFVYSGELPDYLFKAWIDMQIAGDKVIENVNAFGDSTYFVTNSEIEKINKWYDEKLLIYNNSLENEDADLLKTIEQTIIQNGSQVILIDNLMTAIDLDLDPKTDKYEKQSMFVKKLARMALKYNVLILLVAHKRKSTYTTDFNDDVSGSSDITNLAGVVISYDRNMDEKITADRLLRLIKSRVVGKTCFSGIPLFYSEKSKRIYGDKDDVNKKFSYAGFERATPEEENIFS